MKPEHTKEFNAEHAKAGAPYCQRNGLAARIGIWDGRSFTTNTCLIGEYEYSEGRFSATPWLASGGNPNGTRSNDLIMLPLGYCEGKPVFVGDELINGGGRAFTVEAKTQIFSTHKWPRKAPVMPRWFDNEYDNDVMVKAMVIRPAIEAYWKAVDEFNRVTK